MRITHLPTGIVVSCQNQRSQHQNKDVAMKILAAKLAERAREERRPEMAALAGEQRDVAWGSQIRSYVLHPYQMVKDLRTDHEVGQHRGRPRRRPRRLHGVVPALAPAGETGDVGSHTNAVGSAPSGRVAGLGDSRARSATASSPSIDEKDLSKSS